MFLYAAMKYEGGILPPCRRVKLNRLRATRPPDAPLCRELIPRTLSFAMVVENVVGTCLSDSAV